MKPNDMDQAINPPLWLRGRPDEPVRTLDEAARFLRSCDDRNGHNRVGLLRQLQVAKSAQERRDAALRFKAWIEAERLLLVPRGAERT